MNVGAVLQPFVRIATDRDRRRSADRKAVRTWRHMPDLIGAEPSAMQTEAHPLVAVVTPVLNGEEFLTETMESVQALEYPNLVHVILDNASTDDTPAIIERYRARRVPLLTARNARTIPMSANWNAAVALVPSEARYFRILCADDTLYPDAISRLVTVAERDPDIGIVGCLWRAEGLCGEELPADREIFDGREVIRGYLRREHSALSGMHVLVRRTEWNPRRQFYDESLGSADTEANLRICLNAKYGFVRAELGTWRIHANSTTSKVAARSFTHETCWLTLLDRYGPAVLGFRPYMECRTAYRRHLLRRVVKASVVDRSTGPLTICQTRLTSIGDPVGLTDFADAFLDWAVLALMQRRHRVGKPPPQTALRGSGAGVALGPGF
jgi:glycosyltransferase involved in cell wall biosynthesis